MNYYTKSGLLITSLMSATLIANTANADQSWFVRPNIGFSSMSDQTVNATDVADTSGSTDVNIGSGFLTGLGLGYRFNDKFSAELAWEYRTNDSEVSLSNGQLFEEGNYASNTFFLNAAYSFDNSTNWIPYIGAGLSWIQEVDIDIETDVDELSYSSDGDIGFQVFAGLGYQISGQWQLQTELRYGQTSGIELTSEDNTSGQFSEFDYTPITAQVSLVYDF